ncbi:failed axon connections homolog isoform X1 [Centruroides vittatus]|uniref:failed axon connections homolog isoform X1 n=2 Tax=Centruroides vittatus TaxID=120091 RepID=UPI003510A367
MWNSLDATRNSLSTFLGNAFSFQTVKRTPRVVLYFVLFAAAVITSRKVILMKNKRKQLDYSKKRKDVVILHHFSRSVGIPSLSPFVLKLETYLRMAKIPYENDFSGSSTGPKGKVPYITLNGMEMGDSQLIIEFLNEKYNINLSSNLSNEQKAIARALRIMAEDHFFWCLILYRWFFDDDCNVIKATTWSFPLRLLLVPIIRRILKRQSWNQGIGRHTDTEVMDMARNDILALSVYLGNKKFFMGNEPSEVDCALFGFLAQLVYTPMPEFEKLINEDMKNIKEYCKRMKERFWSDWN